MRIDLSTRCRVVNPRPRYARVIERRRGKVALMTNRDDPIANAERIKHLGTAGQQRCDSLGRSSGHRLSGDEGALVLRHLAYWRCPRIATARSVPSRRPNFCATAQKGGPGLVRETRPALVGCGKLWRDVLVGRRYGPSGRTARPRAAASGSQTAPHYDVSPWQTKAVGRRPPHLTPTPGDDALGVPIWPKLRARCR